MFVFTAVLLLQILPFTTLIEEGGLLLLFAIIFLETAILLGVFVPGGDSLLITLGFLCGTNVLALELPTLIATLILAAVSGDVLGYYLGQRMGKSLATRPDSWFFRRRHLQRAEKFYRRHGRLTLLFGRFLPVVRTFNPALSGSSGMPVVLFVGLSLLSASFWVLSLLLGSFYIGRSFPNFTEKLHLFLPAIVLILMLPLALKYFRREQQPA